MPGYREVDLARREPRPPWDIAAVVDLVKRSRMGDIEMPRRFIIGGSPKASAAPAREQRKVPAVLLNAVKAVILGGFFIAVVVGIYTLFSLPGRADQTFKHEVFPVTSARRGYLEPLQAENRARKRDGQPLLPAVRGRRHISNEDRENLAALQEKLRAAGSP